MKPTWANLEAAYTDSPSGARWPAIEATTTRSAACALEQVRQARAHRVEKPLDVDVDHLLDVRGVEVEKVAVGADAGVCDHDVEPAEALDRGSATRPRPDRRRARRTAGRARPGYPCRCPGARPSRPSRPRGQQRWQVAAPMPLLAPVTRATRPSSVLTICSPSVAVVGVRLRGRHVQGGVALEEAHRLQLEPDRGRPASPASPPAAERGGGRTYTRPRCRAHRWRDPRSSTPAARHRRGACWGSRRRRSARSGA